MGELEPWIDEAFVRNIWFQMGEPVNVKMIRDKFSGYAYAPFQCDIYVKLIMLTLCGLAMLVTVLLISIARPLRLKL